MHHFETTKPYLPSARYGGPQQPTAASPAPAPTPRGTESGTGGPGKEPWRLFEHTFPASSPSGGQVAPPGTPEPAVSTAVPSVLSRGIEIAGWTITATKGPIANSAQMDSISSDFTIPPPEMLFPSNSLIIAHPHSGFSYTFDAVRALSSVHGVAAQHSRVGLDLREEYERAAAPTAAGVQLSKLGSKPKSKGIKVAYAQEWGKSRTELPAGELSNTARPDNTPSSAEKGAQPASGSFFGPGVAQAIASASIANATSDIASARDYDWTYSNTWPGAVNAEQSNDDDSKSSRPEFQTASDPALDRIPIEKLGVGSEPILFYDEVVLYEDELADNGSSMLSVKVRVMPSGFLVLQRFLLRVDNVLFRIFDTRMYASFTPPSPSDSAAGSVPPPSFSNTYAGTVRPTPRPTSIPTLEPGRPSGSLQSAGNASLPQGMAKLTLGPTRRQMRETAAAAENSAPSASPAAPSPAVLTETRAEQQTFKSMEGEDDPSGGAAKSSLRVIRECAGWEASYAEVKSLLPPYKAWDLSPLTDPNWISSTLQSLASRAPAGARSATPSPYYAGSADSSGVSGPTLAPASYAALSAVGPTSAQILGAVDEDKWEGVGSRADVALVPHHQLRDGSET
ncbi:hypothetical protein CF326_g243 [Tilletia indica]|uniref:Uncharacterized protein n=1 Tax=Tilletia indica TaxID=43049 RepID=A0A177TK79_9BASI|nr:hypothetical protein CF326_g243 [Tilletia indica]KAE8259133.1 hypothetical protein A4X13_0g1210 [Tilletia indica]